MIRCLFCLLFVFLLTSCETTQWITIKIQKPGQVDIPSSIQNIAVVNNSAVQPDDIGHNNIIYTKDENIAVSSDSLNRILTEALTQFMNEEGYFQSVTYYPTPLRENATFLTEEAITPGMLTKIADETQSDAVVSLERLILRSTQRNSNIGNSLTSEKLCVNINANFRVYLINEKKMLPTLAFKDSICWEGVRQGNFFFSDSYPSRYEALKLAALFTADRMTTMLSPYWQDEDRMYYIGLSKDADAKASQHQWREAALAWGSAYETEKNELKKAKLATNIALANEMLDDVENSLTWAGIASDIFISNQKFEDDRNVYYITLYKQVLEQRIKDFHQLDK